MRRAIMLAALVLASCGASTAFAQSTYPTVSGPRVNGVVPLQCDVNGANCAPIASANPAPTGTGTAATQVQGTAAHDAAYVGNPIGNGCYASSTAPTAVQAGDVARGWCGLAGNNIVSIASASGSTIVYASTYAGPFSTSQNALATFAGLYAYDGSQMQRMTGDLNGVVTQPYALTGSRWNYAAASGGITNSTTAVTIAAAGGASVRNYVTALQCDTDALGLATELAIRDGAGGTVLWRGGISTAGWINGRDIIFNVPLKGTANTLIEIVTLTASVTGSVRCNAQGYTGA